ncbi:small, acid-soluble spore protein, alpha/beta type [Sporohalobacter salinus]|uniref:small, acid-soluble spore protein, alpha/beta type n=1 Tax=Sporohalobacter salinus TaxID=1494606 RepID=UPI0019610023|nr:small, acid-soluble spore protein, alpha/beta type [Sporohalobacter salinus]MBM7623348.1 small acid-soluble spore protein F (minor alpha/beta-type SASP) [Sporohalobacter salinus]
MGDVMSNETKYELAKELGFAHKVEDGDWGNITTREAGSLVKKAIEMAEEEKTKQMTQKKE